MARSLSMRMRGWRQGSWEEIRLEIGGGVP